MVTHRGVTILSIKDVCSCVNAGFPLRGLLRRQVSRFVDRSRSISEKQDDTADNEEEYQSEDRLAERSGGADDYRKHQLTHPRGSLLGDLI